MPLHPGELRARFPTRSSRASFSDTKKAAFTDAKADKKGLFEMAQGRFDPS